MEPRRLPPQSRSEGQLEFLREGDRQVRGSSSLLAAKLRNWVLWAPGTCGRTECAARRLMASLCCCHRAGRMPAGHGLRARTRDTFSRAFKGKGYINLTTYLRTYRVGDYVDIKVNSAVHKVRGAAHGTRRLGSSWPPRFDCRAAALLPIRGAT